MIHIQSVESTINIDRELVEFFKTLALASLLSVPKSSSYTVGKKPTFYPKITKTLMFEKCEFCEK